MNIFNHSDYLEVLKSRITDSTGERGYLSRLAEAAGCQRSYLSLVLKGRVHLTPEHAVGLAKFWALDEQESEYFLQLVHLGRTNFPPLIQKIQARLKAIQAERDSLSERYKQKSLTDHLAQQTYYSSWMLGAVHVIVDIEKYRTADAIAKRLSISPEMVRSTLETLEKLGLVKRSGSAWVQAGGNLHIGKDSPLNTMNHQNWRSRAVLDAQLQGSDGLHYSAIQTLSAKDFEKVKELILQLLDQQRKLVGPSASEEIACFTCDWFKI